MQNIHVIRYSHPSKVGYAGAIEPDDRSWILFIPDDGAVPQLWQQSEVEVREGKTVSGYSPVMEGGHAPGSTPLSGGS